MKTPTNFPALQLMFAADGKKPFLLEGLFYKDAGSDPVDICASIKQGKPFRALCIMLLLAKHHGGKKLDKFGRIRFSSKLETANWVHSLGTLGDDDWEKIRGLFPETYCLDMGRGTTHTKSKVGGHRGKKTSEVFYQPSFLPLKNLEFYTKARMAPARTPEKEILAGDLVECAMTLEQYEVARYVPGTITGWQPCVKEILQNFRKERSSSPSGSEEAQAGKLVSMTANWEDFFTFTDKAVGAEIKEHFRSPGIGDDWYVICVTPAWLIDWKRLFRDAIEKSKVNLKWAQHAPTAAECRSVKSQWEMIYGFDYPKATVVREVEGILARSIDDFKPWHEGSPGVKKAGSFELWQSSVAHYFMGVLSVPKGQKARDGRTPKGTICLVQPFPMYPLDRQSRCGFYLKSPSPMLDVYYHSFLRFFEQGKADGHLTKVDFTKPRRKRA